MNASLMTTIIAGVSVFVIGQFLLKLVIEPIVTFKNTLGEVSALFLREQAKITNANASEEIRQELLLLSSSILARKQSILYYRFFAFILQMPSASSLVSACQSLNRIAHLAYHPASEKPPSSNNSVEIHKEMKNINEKLKITVSYS